MVSLRSPLTEKIGIVTEQTKERLIRAAVLVLGVWLLFFPPAFVSGHALVKLGGTLLVLNGVLGPHRMGIVITAVLLATVYVLGMGLMWAFALLRRDDPLAAPNGDGFWHQKPPPNPNIEPRRRIRFQF